ncbi:MAG TPA: DUF6265 family protein [Gemmatimonadaceae bacterium]|nr:DUF6265 family protein [Gemmatimonadaceae bacterium]
MTKHRAFLLLGFTAVGCLGFTPRQRNTIDRVSWLTGCWQATNAERTVYEQWTAPEARAMLGTSRTVRRDSLVEYELVVVREHGERLAYHAHPSGQATTTFFATSVGESSVTFENPQHDFPQKIGYERRGADSLVAWISGPRAGTTRRIDFPYKRISCG